MQDVGLRAADEVLGSHDRVGALPDAESSPRSAVMPDAGALEADGVDAVARKDDVVPAPRLRIVSSPAPAQITSSPAVPLRVSPADVPLTVQVRGCQSGTPRRPASPTTSPATRRRRPSRTAPRRERTRCAARSARRLGRDRRRERP